MKKSIIESVDAFELFLYLLTMSGTPGPNTILSLQNASEKGIRKGISLNLGMLCGITLITAVTYVLISVLSSIIPRLTVILQILSIVYILFLSWKMFTKSRVEDTKEAVDGSFRRGFLLQLVNVKVLMLCVSTISTYILPAYGKMLPGFLLSLTIPLMCFVTGLVWAAMGEMLKVLYNAHRRTANIIFAISLLALALKSLFSLVQTLTIAP